MFCSKCGNGMNETDKFCPSCGNFNTTQEAKQGQPNNQTAPNHGQQGQMNGQVPPQQNVNVPPQYAQPTYNQYPQGQPQYAQPNYNQHTKRQGQYTQPNYGQSQGQPNYGQPQGQPNYGQPQGQPNYQMNGNSTGAAYGNPQQGMYNTDAVEYVVSSNMFLNFKTALTEKYASFEGRATRWEYWSFSIAYGIIYLVALVINDILASLVSLAFFLPSIALNARRLHDTNRSGWYMLIPIYGGILAAFAESDPLPNQYGKVRKQPNQ